MFANIGYTKCSQAHALISFIQSCAAQSGEPHPVFASEGLNPFITNHDTITFYQLTSLSVECFKQVILEHSIFPVFHVAGIKIRICIYLQK